MVREVKKEDLNDLLHLYLDLHETLTGSKKQSTFDFYFQSGYNSTDKKAFIQWLE